MINTNQIIMTADALLDGERKLDFEQNIVKVLDWITNNWRNYNYNRVLGVEENAIRGMIVNQLIQTYEGLAMSWSELRGYMNSDITFILERLKLILINMYLFVKMKIKTCPEQKWSIHFDVSYIKIYNYNTRKNRHETYQFGLSSDKTYRYILQDVLSGMILYCETDTNGCFTDKAIKQCEDSMYCG